MAAIKLQTLLVDSVQDVRDIPAAFRRSFEVLVRPLSPNPKRYLFDPSSRATDDGDTVLMPTVTETGACCSASDSGRWLKEQFATGGAAGDDTDDLTHAQVAVHVLLRL